MPFVKLEVLPLSLLNDFFYCPRRASLKMIDGCREENEHTILGDLAHAHADLPGYEVAKGVLLWRALPVWSERLGLSGKCDIVEVELGGARYQPAPSGNLADGTGATSIDHPGRAFSLALPAISVGKLPTETGESPVPPIFQSRSDAGFGGAPNATRGARVLPGIQTLVPVEYKKGKRRRFDNDDAQLCAQALCLEEMFGVALERGAVFHAASKRRREVEFTAELRQLTETAILKLREMIDSQLSTPNPQLPKAVFKPACEECSLFEICLPKITGVSDRLVRAANRASRSRQTRGSDRTAHPVNADFPKGRTPIVRSVARTHSAGPGAGSPRPAATSLETGPFSCSLTVESFRVRKFSRGSRKSGSKGLRLCRLAGPQSPRARARGAD